MMTSKQARQSLQHPDHGEMPVCRLLDCVFAMSPNGRILHFHVEQTDVETSPDHVRYTLTTREPQPERARSQNIQPFEPEIQRKA